jgi:hypothetical protein
MEVNQNFSPFVSFVPPLYLRAQSQLLLFLSGVMEHAPQTMHEPFRVRCPDLGSDLNGC